MKKLFRIVFSGILVLVLTGGSYISIREDNYVIIKLRGSNYIASGEQEEIGHNDGMSAIHVSRNATVKITSENGDGSTDGTLTAKGGGENTAAPSMRCTAGPSTRSRS